MEWVGCIGVSRRKWLANFSSRFPWEKASFSSVSSFPVGKSPTKTQRAHFPREKGHSKLRELISHGKKPDQSSGSPFPTGKRLTKRQRAFFRWEMACQKRKSFPAGNDFNSLGLISPGNRSRLGRSLKLIVDFEAKHTGSPGNISGNAEVAPGVSGINNVILVQGIGYKALQLQFRFRERQAGPAV